MLRDYQQEMMDRLKKAWKRHRSVMVQMPTGTGKTRLIRQLIIICEQSEQARAENGQFLRPDGSKRAELERIIGRGEEGYEKGKVLIVAHRRELIEQIKKVAIVAPHSAPEEKAPHSAPEKKAPHSAPEGAQGWKVESIQKLARADEEDPIFKEEFSLIIVDEAHHALAETYRRLWEKWPRAKFLGLTATPCRLSGNGFTDLFDVLLQSWSIQEFIDKGWLSDFEYVSAAPNSLMAKKVRTLKKRSAGDYQEAEMVTVLDVPESIAHLYQTYRRFANGKKGIVYAINRAHAQHIADYYQEHGVSCAMIDAKTPAKERDLLVEAYRRGTRGTALPDLLREDGTPMRGIDVLVNVDIFSEGFDCPEVEFIQLARPTLSLSKYLQQVGRGMRVSKGKPHVLILDQVGLYQTFGLPTEDRDWRQMFLGKQPGKGKEGRIVLVDDDSMPKEKELHNLEMVRIKKGGSKGAGLEVFLQGALYGVMLNGKVTCPAKFKEVVRIRQNANIYALGMFSEKEHTTNTRLYMQYNFLTDLFTVINKKGEDMGARFYGDRYSVDGDFVCGERLYDGELTRSWWDCKTGHYYYLRPEVRMIHGMEIVCEGEKGKFRQVTGKLNPEFALSYLYYNKFIALSNYHLVVRKDNNHAYKICGYLNDSIIVQNDRSYGYLQILKDGTIGNSFVQPPKEMTLVRDSKLLGLKRLGE